MLLRDHAGAQANELLLTALARTMARWTGCDRMLVETEGHGREEFIPGPGRFTHHRLVHEHYIRCSWISAAQAGCESQVRAVQSQLRGLPQAGSNHGILRYLSRSQTAVPDVQPTSISTTWASSTGRRQQRPCPLRIAPNQRDRTGPPHRRSALLYLVGIVSGSGSHSAGYTVRTCWRRSITRVAQMYLEELRSIVWTTKWHHRWGLVGGCYRRNHSI